MHYPKTRADRRIIIRSILLLTFARFVINMTRRFPYPFLPAIGRELNVPLSSVQSVIAAQAGVGLTSPFFGAFGERFGRKNVMLASLAGMTVSGIMGALLPSFAIFALVMMILGAGKMIFDPAMQAYLGDRVPYRRRGMALGIIELSWAGSLIIVAPITGFLLEKSTLQVVFALLTALLVAALAAVWIYLPPDHVEDGIRPTLSFWPWGTLRQHPAALGGLGFSFLATTANEMFFINYGAWMETSFELVLAALGLATVVIAAAEIIGEFAVIGIADRFGKRRFSLLGALIAGVSYLILPLLSFNIVAALAGLFVMFVFVEVSIVSSISLFTEVMPNARSIMMSSNVGAHSLGRVMGAALGGALYALTDSFLIVGIGAAALALGALYLMWRYVTEGS